MTYHWDKFLHIGAVTAVNNRDHALDYAIEGEIKSRIFLINSAVGCTFVEDERSCYYFKWLIVKCKSHKTLLRFVRS